MNDKGAPEPRPKTSEQVTLIAYQAFGRVILIKIVDLRPLGIKRRSGGPPAGPVGEDADRSTFA
jgi:hypothetical protein